MASNKLFIIAVALIVAVVALLGFLVLKQGWGGGGGTIAPATLEFWGTFDDINLYRDAISAFQKDHPNTRINYKKFPFDEYEKNLIDAFAAGNGPDIWMIHNTWLPKHKDKIQPLPQKVESKDNPLMTLRDFESQFVDVAEKDLVSDGQIYGLPIYIDTLALYFNKEILNSAGITTPPATWEELNNAVEAITQIDSQNKISRSGISMGTAKNINRSTDILALLMMQSGLALYDPEIGVEFSKTIDRQDVGEVALKYFTDFSNPRSKVYTWNNQMDYSIDAFRNGKSAMMLNYSHHVQTLRSQAPRFEFGVAPAPQINNSRTINYANYWAPTVSKISKNPEAAWEFLAFMSGRVGSAIYLNASNRPPARRDLVELIKNDVNFGVFAEQALSAKSWYQVDSQAIETIFAEMIDDVNFSRRSVKEALRFAESQVSLLISKYEQQKIR